MGNVQQVNAAVESSEGIFGLKSPQQNFGYDLAGESVRLFNAHELAVFQSIEDKNDVIEKLVYEMEDLNAFLSILADTSEGFTTENEHEVDYEKDQRRIDLVRRLSSNPELQHIFPPTKSSWMEGEIVQVSKDLKKQLSEWQQGDNVQRLINQRIEGPLQRKINRTSEEIMLDQDNLSKATELFNRGLQRMLSLSERILSNIQRAH